MGKTIHYKQIDEKDCGPTCLKIIAKYHDQSIPVQTLRKHSETTRSGSSLLGLSNAAEAIGFRSMGVKISADNLSDIPLPCVLHWNKNHYVVLFEVSKGQYTVSDPAHGILFYGQEELIQHWIGAKAKASTKEGVALLLEPTPKLYDQDFSESSDYDLKFISKYLFRYKKFIYQLLFGLVASSLLQLILPFLTQSVVDVGIQNQDINFIYLILFAQISLFVGKTVIDVIRSWILLHLSSRINISLISDFFIKLMKLPIAFFDTRMTGDILQRINDHSRIERILTSSSLNVLFSCFNLIIFGCILAYYNLAIFSIFLVGSIIYFLWIRIFLKKRSDVDYKRFSQLSEEQSKTIELINGMQEIKLHNAERKKRWGWEFMQAKLFKISLKGLALEQYQQVGANFINELKNILITALSAKLVIDGELTLGMMLSITYIVGQLNSPISQLLNFTRELQDARISLRRLGEIHNREDEEILESNLVYDIPMSKDIEINNLSFKYIGTNQLVLKNLNLKFPVNKVSAIVGASGSGKTTLMKLLLKFYEPKEGSILMGNIDFKNLSQKAWRECSGTVMQEGFIFNDTIAQNIAVGVDVIDKHKLKQAVEVANIKDFIESLPLSYNTKIGAEGLGLSTGQKQRILIARAVYKDPKFLFFDEATSALDARNEKVIIENLNKFFKNRTVIVIAHRLSTVKHADQIIVLNEGEIEETGSHEGLVRKKGSYYNLVKNQLELAQ